MRRKSLLIIMVSFFLAVSFFLGWQAALEADEPRARAGDAVEVAMLSGQSQEFLVAVKFIGEDSQRLAPKVRLRDGQKAQVIDQTQTPFVIGETVTMGIKSPAICVATEGISVDVRTTSTDSPNHVLLDLSAEKQKIDKVEPNGPHQSVHLVSVKKQGLSRVRLGEKTRLDFDDLQLEVVVTAVH